jgi:hypothetical protein
METYLITLDIAVIALIVLAASAAMISKQSSRPMRRPLAWHRMRRSIQRALAGGVMLR